MSRLARLRRIPLLALRALVQRIGSRRFLVRALAILGFVVVGLLVGARFYLRSSSAAHKVQQELQTTLGVPVEVDSAVVQLTGESTLTNLRLIDLGDGQPFLEAEQAVADLSAWSVLRGVKSPRRIDLFGVHLRLRFDASGNLLTQLPHLTSTGAALPALRIRAASITLEQQGRHPFTLEGISLTLRRLPEDNLFGILDDPVWGTFDITGHVEQSGALSFTLKSDGVALTHAMLKSLPFVPPSLWTQIEADGPAVPLTFTLDVGTRAPWVSYTVTFDKASITLPHPGERKDPFRVASARAVLIGNEDGFKLDGTLSDPYWGAWTVKSALVAGTGALSLDLATPEAFVNPRKLAALPYVPQSVWQQVQATGRTSAQVHVDLFTSKQDVHYRVDLDVKAATVHVSSIDLTSTDATGRVIVEDSRVWLKGVKGRTAGGTIATSADMDFRADPLMKFDLKLYGPSLKELPKKWTLPADKIEGKVNGWAKLKVAVHGDAVDVTGEGTGSIDDVKLVGLPAKPILLDLEVEDNRIRIKPRSVALHMLLYAFAPGSTTRPTAFVAARARRPALVQPARMVGRAVTGVTKATHWLIQGASAVLQQAARLNLPVMKAGRTTYLNATVQLDDVDLADLIKRLGVALPIEVTDRLSFRVKVGIPLLSARDFKTYRLEGVVNLPQVNIQGLELNRVEANVQYANGLLKLEKLSGELPNPAGKGGTFAGNARLQVLPRGDLAFDLGVRELPVGRLVRPLPGMAGKVSGVLSGTIRATVPLERLQTPAAWTGLASLRVPLLEVYGVTFKDVSAGLTVIRGLASLSDVKGELHGAPLTGSASLLLSGSQRFQAELKVRGIDVGQLATLLPSASFSPSPWTGLAARGTVETSAQVRGTLTPLTIQGSGQLRTGSIRVGGFQLDRLSLTWKLKDWQLRVSDFLASLYKGKVTGSAEIPLTVKSPAGRVDIAITDVDLSALAATFKALPVRLTGRVSGRAVGTYRPPAGGKLASWNGELDLSAATVKVQDIPAQKLRGHLQYSDGKAEYRLEGDTLGGKFSIEGTYPQPPPTTTSRYNGRFRLLRVRLRQLWRPLGLHERLGALYGTVTLDIPFRYNGEPTGEGRFEVHDLRWHGRDLAEPVIGDIRLNRDGVFIRDVSADFAGGLLRASVSYRWHGPGEFTVHLTRAEASQLLVFEDSAAEQGATKELAQGQMDLHVRGSLGQEWRGSGAVVLSRSKVVGIEVTEWRVPFDFTFAPTRSRGELTVRESSAQLGQGRAQVRASLTWSDTVRVEGNVRLLDASLRSLAGLIGDVSSYAQGRVTGRIDFGGSEMRSLNDLTATVQATLHEAQAMQLPILNLAVPYLVPGLGSTTFRKGDLQARLGNGVWRIAQLALENSLAQLIVQGTISLQGRLDLDVHGRTSTLGGLNPLLARLLLVRLPPVGPVPITLIIEVTQLLSNRLIHLRITGTTKAPRIQVEPIRLLSEEAVRFFLERILIPGR